jgi:hypothetical protein
MFLHILLYQIISFIASKKKEAIVKTITSSKPNCGRILVYFCVARGGGN